jgi:hypothetical protein
MITEKTNVTTTTMNNRTNVVHPHSPLLASNHRVEQLSIGTTKERTIISTGPHLTDTTTVSTPKTDTNIQLAATQEPTEIHGTTTPIMEHHAIHETPKLCTPQPHETQTITTHGEQRQIHSAQTLLTNPQITLTHSTTSTQLQHQSN